MIVLPLIVFGFYLVPILLLALAPRGWVLAVIVLVIVLPAIYLIVEAVRGSGGPGAMGFGWSILVSLALAVLAGVVVGLVARALARMFARIHPRGVIPTWIVAMTLVPGLAFYAMMGAQQGTLFSPASVGSVASPPSKSPPG